MSPLQQKSAPPVIAPFQQPPPLPDLFEIIRTTPQDDQEAKSETWQRASICYKTIQEGDSEPRAEAH